MCFDDFKHSFVENLQISFYILNNPFEQVTSNKVVFGDQKGLNVAFHHKSSSFDLLLHEHTIWTPQNKHKFHLSKFSATSLKMSYFKEMADFEGQNETIGLEIS